MDFYETRYEGTVGRVMKEPAGRGAEAKRGMGWILLSCLVIVGCSQATRQVQWAETEEVNRERRARIERMYTRYKRLFPSVTDISTAEAIKRMKDGKAVFVDVREPEEQAVSMLPDAITEQDFLADPEKYKYKVVIGYCTISYRSGRLAKKLAKRGILMRNLRGGMLAWVHDGGKVYDRRGETLRVHVYGRKWNLVPIQYRSVY